MEHWTTVLDKLIPPEAPIGLILALGDVVTFAVEYDGYLAGTRFKLGEVIDAVRGIRTNRLVAVGPISRRTRAHEDHL